MKAKLATIKNGGDFEFFKQNLDFAYVFTVFDILSVSKKHIGFLNLKWRIQYIEVNVQKFDIFF